MNWDVFVSHAFEDNEFASEIAESLKRIGFKVWFDGFELHVGDSLRRSIDNGLSKSRFGIVILSPSFFAKEWTQRELDALTSRETKGKKIILPIWHHISVQEIIKYSPILADRFAIDSKVGIDKTIESLLSVIKQNTSKAGRAKDNAKTDFVVELQNIKRVLLNKQKEIDLVVTQAHEVASTDSLTFLPNRFSVLGDLRREVLFSERNDTALSISMLDLDNFKQINDTYGHLIGDDVLKLVANKLQDNIREPNIIGRYGGEEFLVIMPNNTQTTASEQAELLCQQIRSTSITFDNHDFHITISMGIARVGQVLTCFV